jgi:radical SAM superfamily enzyme YgiQ (UPF0313 family)
MKIIFAYKGVENLGIEYLAAEARGAGHEVGLVFDPAVFGGSLMWNMPRLAERLDLTPRIVKKIADEKPGAVAFSCVSANYRWALSIAREVKKIDPGIRTVFGGAHVTAVPERVIAEPAVDALVTGEATLAFAPLLGDWEAGRNEARPGLWAKCDGGIVTQNSTVLPTDLDALPFPAKDLFYEKVPMFEDHYTIMTSRGCPFRCSYCHNSNPGARAVRVRSVENVMAELEPVTARGRSRLVKFFDEIFTMNPRRLEEFAGEYRKRIHIPYFCYTYPGMLDGGTADLLKESGCVYVTVGVQSCDVGQRKDLLNRNYSNDDVRRCAGLLKDRGITLSIDHIIGIPGDSPERLYEAAEFYAELRPDRLLTYWLTYFPGTGIFNAARGMGLLSESAVEAIESGYVGSLYGDACAVERPLFKKFIVLFSIIPLVPGSWIRFILRRHLHRLLPASNFMINALITVNALRIKDPFFIYNIRCLVSTKKAP